MANVTRIKVVGPLAGQSDGFAEYLTELGYAPASVEIRLRLLGHLSRWLLAEMVDAEQCDEGVLGRFRLAHRKSHADVSTESLGLVVTYLRSVAAVPEPAPALPPAAGSVDDVLDQWREFLFTDRGLLASSVRYYRALGRPLLMTQVDGGVVNFATLDAHAVANFVRETLPGMPIGSSKLMITALRSLLRFLYGASLVATDLSPLVPARAGYRDSGLPRGLNPAEVTIFLAAADRDSPVGRRDLAVVLLLVRLGLRACEVAHLCLEDVDWRAGTLRILGKGSRSDLVPLPADVGKALAAHLQAARRPATAGRAVFVGAIAPYRPLTANTVKAITRGIGQRAGLGRVGSHRLRHTAATATINAGASWEEVGQLLRHRSLESTAIYAKVDVVRLRTLTRPWPGLPTEPEARS